MTEDQIVLGAIFFFVSGVVLWIGAALAIAYGLVRLAARLARRGRHRHARTVTVNRPHAEVATDTLVLRLRDAGCLSPAGERAEADQ